MAKLMDLPPELRVMIWKLCVLSPEGRIAYLDLENGDSPSKHPMQYMYTNNPHFVDDNNDITDIDRICFQPKLVGPTSLSLLRTNRQIYIESRQVFWENTCFNYDSILHLHSEFLRMDLIASGCIHSIRLHISNYCLRIHSVSYFATVLGILITRRVASDQQSNDETPDFGLRQLDLVFDVAELVWIMLISQDNLHDRRNRTIQFRDTESSSYYKLLEVLDSGRNATFEKRIIINCASIEGFHRSDIIDSKTGVSQVLEELHKNWGGKLLWGKKLIWDTMEKVDGGFEGLLDHEAVYWQGKHDKAALNNPKICYSSEVDKLTYYANTRNFGKRI